MTASVVIGVSLKMYFGHREAREWFVRVASCVRNHPATVSGAVEFFVIPTFVQLLPAVEIFADSRARIGAQDIAAADRGAFTGEVSGAELAEIGVRIAEVGHSERRRLFSETDEVVATKVAASLRNGLTPIICVGEAERMATADAAVATILQLQASLADAPDGGIIVAYEPVWAIGASSPAPSEHVAAITRAIRDELLASPARAGSYVIYGGSAGPGLLAELGDATDGLFLGRFAHDPDAMSEILDEAMELARIRRV